MRDRKPGRTRRVVALALYSLFLIWIAYVAVTRWNGVPKNPNPPAGGVVEALVPLDSALDRTNPITAALAAIPPSPPIVLPPPPAGMKWGPINSSGGTIDVSDALYGEWTPERRPNLQGVIAYLELPATTAVLDQLAAIEPGECRLMRGNLSAFRQAAKMLVARARLRHARDGDVRAALTDLETTYRLSSTLMHAGDSLNLLTAIACQALADSEMKCLAHERPFTIEEASCAKEMLIKFTPDHAEMWDWVIESVCGKLDHLLDGAYTDDGAGNGWLVLSRFDGLTQPIWSSEPRSGAWNVLSVLYNDRKTIAAKIRRYRQACEQAGVFQYQKAKPAVEQIESSARCFTILDGPFAQAKFGTQTAYLHRLVTLESERRIGTCTSIALSAFRHDRGTYPSLLDELLGRYLDRLPNDPFDDGPIRYRPLNDGNDYLLYSIGPDGIDDGGTRRSRNESERWNGDEIIRHDRPAASWEPELIESNN